MSSSTRRFATRALRAVPAFVRAHDAAMDLGGAARDVAEDAAYEGKRALRHARRATEERIEQSRDVVRQKPLRSIGIAAAIGAAFGAIAALITRRPSAAPAHPAPQKPTAGK